MHKLTKYALAGALALAGINQASADLTLHVVGSTAFRAATVNAIINRLGSCTAICDDDGSGHNIGNSSFDCFKGTYSLTGGTTNVTIFCTWTGSVAGILDVTGGNNDKYLTGGTYDGTHAASFQPVSVQGSVASMTGATAAQGVVTKATATFTATSKAEITMADNKQAFTKFTSPALTETEVGIVPFAWVASNGAPSGLTNVGPNALRAIFTSGFVSGEVLTGNPADSGTISNTTGTLIYAIGRNNGSGTRVNAFAEPGIGIFSSVSQFTMAANVVTEAQWGGSAPVGNTVSDIAPDDRQIQLNGVVVQNNSGTGGEESGGNLANDLRYITTSVTDDQALNSPRNIAFISYLGEPDSYTAVTGSGASINGGNAKYLTYNGIAGFGGSFFNDFADTTLNSNQLTVDGLATGSFSGVIVGQAIRGPAIQADTTVLSVSGNTITMSKTATATLSGNGSSGNSKSTVALLLPNNIRTGQYTFWGYEYISWDPAIVTGDFLTMGQAIATQITSGGFVNGTTNASNVGDYFAAGLKDDTNMTVKRSGAGAPVVGK